MSGKKLCNQLSVLTKNCFLFSLDVFSDASSVPKFIDFTFVRQVVAEQKQNSIWRLDFEVLVTNKIFAHP